MRAKRWVPGAAAAVVLAAVAAGCGGGGSSSGNTTAATTGGAAAGKPIVIGAAIDYTNLMKFTDDPAYYGAQLEVKKINAAGGVDGRPLKFITENTKLKPDLTKKAALDLIGKGADIGWVTCDVDWSTPAVQEFLSKKMLTIAPCIGTDQMGPKRFGSAGDLAFSFGNVAQDEGAALAAMAKKNGYKTAVVVTDKVIVYTRNVCEAFSARFQKLGGKVIDQESFTNGDNTISSVVTSVNNQKPSAIVICTIASPDAATFLSGIRTLGNNTPIISPWSIDGTFWMPKSPKIATNFWNVTPASIYGDDPNPAVQAMITQLTKEGHAPTQGGFVEGAAAIDGIVAAIKAAGGSTDGAKLAAAMQKFHDLNTISGKVSFSSQYHTAYGREYRVVQVLNGKGHYKYMVKAGTPQPITGK
jgi:branched-chain amino acid transport system substrate-binding protein